MHCSLYIAAIILVLRTNAQNFTICSDIPYSFPTSCNITCETCDTSSSNHLQCSSCPSYFDYLENWCQVPTSKTYYFNEYFATTEISQSQIQEFADQEDPLDLTDVTELCVADKYRFQMAGPFIEEQIIRKSQSFSTQIEQMTVSLRLFFFVEDVTVTIKVNDVVKYSQTISSGISLNATVDSYNNSINSLEIQRDPTDYIDNMFLAVKTPLFEAVGYNFKIQIGLESPVGSSENIWFFSELTIVGLECETCLSQYLTQFRDILGLVIAGSAAVIVVIVGIILLYLKIQNLRLSARRKSEFKKKLKLGKNMIKNLAAQQMKTQHKLLMDSKNS